MKLGIRPGFFLACLYDICIFFCDVNSQPLSKIQGNTVSKPLNFSCIKDFIGFQQDFHSL